MSGSRPRAGLPDHGGTRHGPAARRRLIAFTDPPLTTVRRPVRAMATAAVGALLEEIGGNPVRRTEFVFQPELVVRGSTARRTN